MTKRIALWQAEAAGGRWSGKEGTLLREIKTKPEGGKPKLLERASRMPKAAMKDVWLKAKEKTVSEAKETPFDSRLDESSNAPANSAGEQMVSGIETAVKKGANMAGRAGKTVTRTAARKVKEARETARAAKGLQEAGNTLGEAAKLPAASGKIRTKTSAAKAVKGKPAKAVKTASRSMKGVKQGTRGIKTAQTAARRTRQAAKASVQAIRRAQQVARAAVHTIRAAAHAIAAAAKAAVAAVKSLAAAIAAGGWVVLLIILIVCLVAMLLGSVFGIFFNGEDTGSGQTLQDAVLEIQTGYQDTIEEIKRQYPHDVVEVSGAQIDWPEILSVYAVKTSSTQEVATMDDAKKGELRSVFWDAHTITHHSETRQVTEVIAAVDEDGNLIGTENSTSKTYLLISVAHKTVAELAEQYRFSDVQKQQLTALLQPENDSLWTAALSGLETKDIVSTALTQVDNQGGAPYWRWYGFESRVDWSACFVSWCANEGGFIENGVIPKFALSAAQGIPWFQERGPWQPSSYTPQAGDIIFFDRPGADSTRDGQADHVGIVERVADGRVYTIEGDYEDRCCQNNYSIGDRQIIGYGCPAF